MAKVRLSVGVAGTLVLTSMLGAPMLGASMAAAQEMAAPPAAAPECSGLSCLFRSRSAAPAAPAPAAPDPAQATPTPTIAEADAPDGDKLAAKKARPKPMPVVTIAADSTEAARLKAMAAALPKTRIRIVPTTAAATADFSVVSRLDASDGMQKARLFTEQMHIVAGASVHSVADLKGKVVSFGPDAGVTQSAARKAFESLGVSVKETPLDLANALDGLSTGDVDAVVLLAPQPIDSLRRLSAPGLHLVSWPEGGSVPAGASVATIDGSRYPGLVASGETIRAVGVDAVLNAGTKGGREPAAKAFLNALSQHSAALSKRGFDLIRADLETRSDRRVASAERR